jgi:hypothetical protein
MKPLSCASVQRRLGAYHDDELGVADQIAVTAHLDWCERCAGSFADLQRTTAILRAGAPGREPLSCDEAAGLTVTIVNRVKAEREASFAARLRGMFEDMHLVYAGVGAAAAAVVCVVIMLGMMRFSTRERQDSLAGILNLMAAPEPIASRMVVVDAQIVMPKALAGGISTTGEFAIRGPHETSESSTVFTLSAIVTREGRVANPELLEAGSGIDGPKQVKRLLDAASRARLEPAKREGLPVPVAVNMVWLVSHTTVRAKDQKLDGPQTTARKRVV